LNQIGIIATGVSIALIAYLWSSTINPPATFFTIVVSIQGLLVLYSLFPRILGFGCFKSIVNLFAWLTALLGGSTGIYIIYIFLTSGFNTINQSLFIAWLLLVGKYLSSISIILTQFYSKLILKKWQHFIRI
jgi:hypothetical protein